ncbi:TPA: DUF1149 family protein [Streptococcus suis]
MQCNNCGSEWNVRPEYQNTICNCPFCGCLLMEPPTIDNDIASVLQYLVKSQGDTILKNPKKLYAYVLDMVTGFDREKRFLKIACTNGLIHEFYSHYKTNQFQNEQQTLIFKHRFLEFGFSDELVSYILSLLLSAVDIHLSEETNSKKVSLDKPEQNLPGAPSLNNGYAPDKSSAGAQEGDSSLSVGQSNSSLNAQNTDVKIGVAIQPIESIENSESILKIEGEWYKNNQVEDVILILSPSQKGIGVSVAYKLLWSNQYHETQTIVTCDKRKCPLIKLRNVTVSLFDSIDRVVKNFKIQKSQVSINQIDNEIRIRFGQTLSKSRRFAIQIPLAEKMEQARTEKIQQVIDCLNQVKEKKKLLTYSPVPQLDNKLALQTSAGIAPSSSKKNYNTFIKLVRQSEYDLRLTGELVKAAQLEDLTISLTPSSNGIRIRFHYKMSKAMSYSDKEQYISYRGTEKVRINMNKACIILYDENRKLIKEKRLQAWNISVEQNTGKIKIQLGSVIRNSTYFSLHIPITTPNEQAYEGTLSKSVKLKPTINQIHYDARNYQYEEENQVHVEKKYALDFKILESDVKNKTSKLYISLKFMFPQKYYIVTGTVAQQMVLNSCTMVDVNYLTDYQKRYLAADLFDICDRLTYEMTDIADHGNARHLDFNN